MTVDQVLEAYQLGLYFRGEAETVLKSMGYQDDQIAKALDSHPRNVLVRRSAGYGQIIYMN